MRKKMEILPILRIGIEHFLVAFLPPIVLGLIYHWGNMRIERLEFLLNAMITSTTTCSGFILTSVSILIGLSNTPLMKKINSTRASKELQYRYKENLLVGLALIIVSVLIGTNTEDKSDSGNRFFTAMYGLSELSDKHGYCVLVFTIYH